jgi:hypothetical protein
VEELPLAIAESQKFVFAVHENFAKILATIKKW